MDGAELMRAVAAGFEKSDTQPLLDAMHENIVWKTASRQEGLLRYGGQYSSRSGISQVLASLSREYSFYRFQPQEILSVGDVVWGLFDIGMFYQRLNSDSPRRSINLEMAIRWRLQDGKVIEHQGFFDTASLLIQQGASWPAAEGS